MTHDSQTSPVTSTCETPASMRRWYAFNLISPIATVMAVLVLACLAGDYGTDTQRLHKGIAIICSFLAFSLAVAGGLIILASWSSYADERIAIATSGIKNGDIYLVRPVSDDFPADGRSGSPFSERLGVVLGQDDAVLRTSILLTDVFSMLWETRAVVVERRRLLHEDGFVLDVSSETKGQVRMFVASSDMLQVVRCASDYSRKTAPFAVA